MLIFFWKQVSLKMITHFVFTWSCIHIQGVNTAEGMSREQGKFGEMPPPVPKKCSAYTLQRMLLIHSFIPPLCILHVRMQARKCWNPFRVNTVGVHPCWDIHLPVNWFGRFARRFSKGQTVSQPLKNKKKRRSTELSAAFTAKPGMLLAKKMPLQKKRFNETRWSYKFSRRAKQRDIQ